MGRIVKKHPALVVGGLLILLPLLISMGEVWYVDFVQPIRARNKSVRLLANADSPKAMEVAIGHLGVIFHIQDGSWIAISYVDRHHGGFWSAAVALDSSGQWAVSETHFCGSFRNYRNQWNETIGLIRNPDVSNEEKKSLWEWFRNRAPDLWAIESAESLDIARTNLVKIGFRPYCPDLKPKITGKWPHPVEHKIEMVHKLIVN